MALRQHSMKLDLRSLIVLIVVFALGFAGGLFYSAITSSQTGLSPSTTSPGPICNCPNIPVGENPALCKCQ